jgi:hypothetical protein
MPADKESLSKNNKVKPNKLGHTSPPIKDFLDRKESQVSLQV